MIIISITDTDAFRDAFVEIPSVFGPALRSAMEDMANEIGGRLEGIHHYAKEDALTEAATALGPLRAAVNAVVPDDHPDHEATTSTSKRFYLQDAQAATTPLVAAITQVVPEGHKDYQ